MAKQKDNTTEQINNQNRLNESLKKQQEILGQISATQSEGLETYADTLNLQEQLYTNAKLIATIGAKIDQFSESTSDRARMLVDQYSGQRDLLDEIQSRYAEIVKNSSNIADDSFEIVDLTREQSKLSELLLDTELARDVLGEKEYNKQKSLLDVIKDRLDTVSSINEQQSKANELASEFLSENKTIGSVLNKTLGGIEHLADKFGDKGIIGNILGKKAKSLIEKAREDIKGKVVKAFQETGNAGVTAFSVAKMAVGSFTKYALPALGIAGVLGIFYGMISAIGHLDEEMAEIAKKFTLSREEADKLHHSAIDVAKEMNLVGINSEEVLNSMKETSAVLNGLSIPTQFAQGNEAVKDMVKDVTVLSEKFELGSDEIQGISNLSVITGKSMGQLVKESVKMGKGLLGTKKSIEVIAKLSPSMALNFKKGGIELLKAAQKAKLLGMELSDVQDFGEGILDFESSLEKEMEARVLTGKNINFDLARQYALNNDIAGLQEEMLNQLGSLNDFEKMNFLQRKATAEAFGMTVDQVANILTAQEKLNQLGISQAKMDAIQAKNAEQLAEEAKTTSNEKLKGYLLELAKQKEVETISNRISDAVKKIKETLSATLAPLLEQVHHFLDSAEGAEFIKGTVEGIKVIMTGLVSVIKSIASGIAAMNKMFGGTGSAVAIVGGLLATIATYFVGKALIVKGIGALTNSLLGATSATKQLAGGMQQISQVSSGLGGAGGAGGQLASFGSGITPFAQNAAAIAIVLIAFAASLYITAKAFQEFSKVKWDDVQKGLLVMGALVGVATILAVLGKFLLADGGATAGALIALGAAMVLFSASLLIAAKGLDMISKINWKGFDGMFTAMTKFIVSFGAIGLAAPAIVIGSVALGVASVALGAFAGSVYLLGKGLKSLTELGDMKKAGGNLVAGLGELAKIPKMLDISALEDSFEDLEDALEELDFGDLVAFGDLAKSDMKNAGKNIAEGIESLAQVSTLIDLGSSGFLGMGKTGIAKQLSDFDDAIGQLDLDGVKAFAEIAKTDFTNVGKNINIGIQSLGEVKTEGTKEILSKVEDIFNWFEDALAELDYEEIQQFTSVAWESLIGFSNKFREFLTSLGSLPKNAGSIVGGFGWLMGMLAEAISNIDTSVFDDVANLPVQTLVDFSNKFSSFVKKMQEANTQAPSVIANMASSFEQLNVAIGKLNISKLKELQSIQFEKTEPMGIVGFVNKLIFGKTGGESSTKIQPVVTATPTPTPTPTPNVKVTGVTNTPIVTNTQQNQKTVDSSAKFDRMIVLLEKLVGGLTQPTVIKINDRVIQEITTSGERMKQQNPTRSGGRSIDLVTGTN